MCHAEGREWEKEAREKAMECRESGSSSSSSSINRSIRDVVVWDSFENTGAVVSVFSYGQH
jgi:hypothetical protein